MCKRVFDETIELADNALLKVRPELFDEWDFEKNDKLGLDIYAITLGSNMSVWWICPKCKSSYDLKICRRTSGGNCPYCGGRRVNHTNSLSNLNPSLAMEWHSTLNGELTPNDVSCGSQKKVWWKCKKCDSDYDAIIVNRTQKRGCPYCRGLRVNHTNSLASLFPDISLEWHPTKNGEITPHDVSYGSNKKAWWICPKCESSYDITISSRTSRATKCPYCTGSRTNCINSLAKLNSVLTKEWHSLLNAPLTPDDVTCNSGKNAWWICSEGHVWKAQIAGRNKGSNCPICANKKVLQGFNDMWTTNPELAKLLLNPEDGYKYTSGSHNKVDWKCPQCENLIKNKIISNVRRQGISCLKCSDSILFPEKFMYNLLKMYGIEFEYDRTKNWSGKLRYDFYLPKYNWIIEMHGIQHYEQTNRSGARTLQNEQENDRLKEKLALNNGIKKYVVIDARESTIEYLTNNILKSCITKLVQNIDFTEIGRLATHSLVKEACDLWASGIRSAPEIAKLLSIGSSTVIRYLKRGEEIGWCDYSVNHQQRKIVQLNKNLIFIKEWNSMSEVSRSLNTSHTNVLSVCRGKSKTAGGFKWMYKEDYDKLIAEQNISDSIAI